MRNKKIAELSEEIKNECLQLCPRKCYVETQAYCLQLMVTHKLSTLFFSST